jgi:transposase-like protein
MAGFLSLDELFKGRHFDREVVVLCVRWYLRFKLSFRELVEMTAERGLRWPTHDHALSAQLRFGVRAALQSICAATEASRRANETYVKICGH